MEAKYYNVWEFEQACSLKENNPLEAKIQFEKYLEKYPKDYCAYSYYAYTLIILGEFDEAKRILDYVENISRKDHHFYKDTSKVKTLVHNILFDRLKILSYQGKYEEFFELRFNNTQGIDFTNLNSVDFYCKKKMGTLLVNGRDTHSYLFRQIIDYDESDFLQHINKHSADYNKDSDNPNKGIFVPDFPISQVIEEIKKYVPSNKRLFYGFFEDVHIFKYNSCGRNNTKLVDYFEVISFHDTKDFITMYPISDGKDLPYIDLNYLVNDNKEIKVKRLSQIEKFNQRYGRS